MKTPRLPEFFTDSAGQRCVRVPLAHSERTALVYAEDFGSLMEAGLSFFWQLNFNKRDGQAYVKARLKGTQPHSIARLILGAGRKQEVRYRDGNRLNLRRDNLTIRKGGTARIDTAAMLVEAA